MAHRPAPSLEQIRSEFERLQAARAEICALVLECQVLLDASADLLQHPVYSPLRARRPSCAGGGALGDDPIPQNVTL